jgi:hypothetical protein
VETATAKFPSFLLRGSFSIDKNKKRRQEKKEEEESI